MVLSELPKTCRLGDNFKESYFHHIFNTLSNENYIGLLPNISYYSANTMKKSDSFNFLEWYEEHINDEFNMQRDLVQYSVSDVEILTQACLKYKEHLLSTGNVCPFTKACT